MGQQNSKDELVYQQVIECNIDAIKALCFEGARLEWIDKEGKTPLIVASMDHRLYLVAKTLIELGANVNAYRPGRHAGTPLHHAAKRGLDNTVKLLLSQGANPFLRNDDCQTPLDVARTKGYGNVVRTIEAHICCFSGEVREMSVVPGILEPLFPQRLSRKRSKKSWVVVVPCSLANSRCPRKLELAVYSSPQDPKPRSVIALWKSNIAEPKLREPDPSLIIFDESSGMRHKFLSAIEGDKQQLAQLYSACKGLPQVIPTPQLDNARVSPSSVEADAEAVELAMAISASIHSAANSEPTSAATATNSWGNDPDTAASHSGWGPPITPPPSVTSCNGWANEPAREEHNGWAVPDCRPASSQSGQIGSQENGGTPPVTTNVPAPTTLTPSAPPLPGNFFDNNPVQYPTVDVVPVEAASDEGCSGGGSEVGDKSESSSCVICWEAPVEGACIPCGHMAGCMTCLNKIKSNNGACPVCRAKIQQVIKLYAV